MPKVSEAPRLQGGAFFAVLVKEHCDEIENAWKKHFPG
jgi:hypothetical protein